MPKYVLIGLAIPIILFILMNYWSKISDIAKNRIISIIFAFIAVGFVVLIALLIF